MASKPKNTKPKAIKTNNPKPRRQTSSSNSNVLLAWWNQQKQAVKFSLQRMWLHPISTWITLATIAIALSLPTSMHLLLKNLQTLTDDKREIPTLTLFLKQNVSEQQAKDRAELLSEYTEIDQVQVITRDQALADFEQIAGFAETLSTLEDNPLPHVLIITPKLGLLTDLEKDIDTLSSKLKALPETDNVQIDVEWVMKLRQIISIADRIILIISVLLSITVLLVIGNTIRLDIENRKEEIQVTRLIGATNSYIRRPFIFGGFWFGLFGGVLSLLIVHFALLFLVAPVQKLAEQYGSNFTLSGLDLTMTLEILLASIILGIIGAWLAVGRHLWHIDISN